MTGIFSNLSSRENSDLLLGVVISSALFAFFYPEILFLLHTPMYGTSWELHDPVVSTQVFEPGFRAVQHELYNNSNLLWSNMRAMGLPLLANDIQAAPLFPLTQLLAWLPEIYFWNVFVSLRMILIGLGTYLFARNIFKFNVLSAVVFILCFVYAVYVMRWFNNPWQNSLLAGIWYLYFLCLLATQQQRGFKQLLVFTGLVIAVYSMVTSGFPESAAMCALMVVLIFPTFVFHLWKKDQLDLMSVVGYITLAHIIGFALSSFQIFSILELASLSQDSRGEYGTRQYKANELIPFFSEAITRFVKEPPSLFKDNRTFLGLIPIFLFFIGLGKTLLKPRTINFADTGALLCGVFIVFKMFAIGPSWFNEFVGTLPFLRDMYFYVYFFAMFLWFFAYFTAKGFEHVIYPVSENHQARYFWLISAFLSVIFIVWAAAPIATGLDYSAVLTQDSYTVPRWVLVLFIASVVLVFICHLGLHQKFGLLGGVILIGFMICEVQLTAPIEFARLNKNKRVIHESIEKELINRHGVSFRDTRIIDGNGKYITQQLATIDNGATPLLPVRSFYFKKHMFLARAAGYRQIIKPERDYSWSVTGTGLYLENQFQGNLDVSKVKLQNWEDMKRAEGKYLYLDTINFEETNISKTSKKVIPAGNDKQILLRGWATDSVLEPSDPMKDTTLYVVLKSGNEEIDIPAMPINRKAVAERFQRKELLWSGWEVLTSTHFFSNRTYDIYLRLVDIEKNTYYEKKMDRSITFSSGSNLEQGINDLKNRKFASNEMEFLGTFDRKYLYFDSSALTRSYIASGCTSVKDMYEAVDRLRNNDEYQKGHVYVDGLNETQQAVCSSYRRQTEPVTIIEDKGKVVKLSEVEGPAVVVLSDNVYPGWHAFNQIDGKEIEIFSGNSTFRTLFLEESKPYQIGFQYKPSWQNIARLFLLLAITVYLVIVFLSLRRVKIR